jgi:myotubularin-related protein 5/13
VQRLTPGMLQFAYTCIQDHPVWNNVLFWQSIFYHDVSMQLRQMYMIKTSNTRFETENEDTDNLWQLNITPSPLHVASEVVG